MARVDRETLEEIAIEMIEGSMEYIGISSDEMYSEVEKLTDDELINFLCDL